MAKFAYDNSKNASIGYVPFKLNCNYYLQILFKKNVNPQSQSQSKTANKLAAKLQKLIIIFCKNFQKKPIIKILNLKAILIAIKFD